VAKSCSKPLAHRVLFSTSEHGCSWARSRAPVDPAVRILHVELTCRESSWAWRRRRSWSRHLSRGVTRRWSWLWRRIGARIAQCGDHAQKALVRSPTIQIPIGLDRDPERRRERCVTLELRKHRLLIEARLPSSGIAYCLIEHRLWEFQPCQPTARRRQNAQSPSLWCFGIAIDPRRYINLTSAQEDAGRHDTCHRVYTLPGDIERRLEFGRSALRVKPNEESSAGAQGSIGYPPKGAFPKSFRRCKCIACPYNDARASRRMERVAPQGDHMSTRNRRVDLEPGVSSRARSCKGPQPKERSQRSHP
jgi:hypothetical protein